MVSNKIPSTKNPARRCYASSVAGGQVPKNNKVMELQRQISELTDKWKRALADYQNLEKRINEEKQDFVKFSNSLLITKLLEVLDSLEMAETHLNDQGLTLAINQLRIILKDEGVAEIKIGDKYDPTFMECVELAEGLGKMELIKKGYYLNNKVLRPCKVKVYKGKKN